MDKKKLYINMDPADMAAVKEVRRYLGLSADTAAIRKAVITYMPHQRKIDQLSDLYDKACARIAELERGIIALDDNAVWVANVAANARKGEGL